MEYKFTLVRLFCCCVSFIGFSCSNLKDENQQQAEIIAHQTSTIERLQSDFSNLDANFRNFRFASEQERDSMSYAISNLQERYDSKANEIEILRSRIANASSDDDTKSILIEELSRGVKQLEALVEEKNELYTQLSSRTRVLEKKVDHVNYLNRKYTEIFEKLRSIGQEIKRLEASKPESIPRSIQESIRDQKEEIGRFADSTYFTHQDGYDGLVKTLELNIVDLENHLIEIEKKLVSRYYVFMSKKDLKKSGILTSNSINFANIPDHYKKQVSKLAPSVKLLTTGKRDTPSLLSSHPPRSFEIKRESDFVWNLYIIDPNVFWNSNETAVIAY